MALVTMKKLLEHARSNRRGVGAFSVGNMEMVKGAIKAAEELDTPMMVQGTYANVRHHIEVFNCEMTLDDIDQ